MSKASKHNQTILFFFLLQKLILYKRVLTVFRLCAGFWRVWLLVGFERSRSIITSTLITRWCIFIDGCDHPVLCCMTQPCTAHSSTWWRRSSYSEYRLQTTSFMSTWCLELEKVAPSCLLILQPKKICCLYEAQLTAINFKPSSFLFWYEHVCIWQILLPKVTFEV